MIGYQLLYSSGCSAPVTSCFFWITFCSQVFLAPLPSCKNTGRYEGKTWWSRTQMLAGLIELILNFLKKIWRFWIYFYSQHYEDIRTSLWLFFHDSCVMCLPMSSQHTAKHVRHLAVIEKLCLSQRWEAWNKNQTPSPTYSIQLINRDWYMMLMLHINVSMFLLLWHFTVVKKNLVL